jgi:predicted CDP-diglyceride synthetase/phosphatidate cytidylyltransferase
MQWELIFIAVIPFYVWLFWKPLKLALGGELETFSVIWLLLLTVAVIAASAYLAAQPYNLGA